MFGTGESYSFLDNLKNIISMYKFDIMFFYSRDDDKMRRYDFKKQIDTTNKIIEITTSR